MATYTLHAPFEISSRLMPAVQIGGATISLEYGSQGQLIQGTSTRSVLEKE